EGNLRLQRSLGQVDDDAVTGPLDVANVYQVRQCRGPKAAKGPPAGVQGQVSAATLVVPAWRHDPGVVASKIAFLRSGERRLVPGMPLVHRVADRIGPNKGLLILPIVVVRAAQKDADAQVNVDEVVGDQLTVHDDSRGDEHAPPP